MERQAGRGLVWFDRLLGLMFFGLVVASVFVPGALLFNGGTAGFQGRADVPYTVRHPDGSRTEVDGRTTTHRGNQPLRAVYVNYPRELPVGVNVRVDGSVRVVLGSTIAAMLALGWLGLVNLRRIVRSARHEDPFVLANVRRFRRLAAALLVWPVVGWFAARAVEGAIDLEPGIRLLWQGPSTWTSITIGLGVLALAQVFQEAVSLRDLERGTV